MAAEGPVTRKARRWIIVGIVALAAALRVGALLAWRGQPPPPDTKSFLEQARALITSPERDEQGRPLSNQVDEWFHRHRKPPLFSGLVGGAVWICELFSPYDPQAEGFDHRTGVNEIVRAHMLMEAAYWLALVGGLWMLRPAWLILRRCGSEPAALAGLAMVAVTPVAVTYSAVPLSDTVYAGVFLYTIALLFDGLFDHRFDSLITAGMLAGLAFLTRSEALLLAPVAALLLALGAVAKKLTLPFALGGAAVFVVAMLALAVPYVLKVSQDEGRFTIRRNAGNLLLHDIGVSADKNVPPEQRQGEAQAIGRNIGRIAARWPGFFLRNIYDASSFMLGYVGMCFVVAGMFFAGRRLFAWESGPAATLIYLLCVAGLSIFQPNGRLLLSPLFLLGPLMGLGAVGLADEVIRWNPAGVSERGRAALRPWLVVGCVATLLVATLLIVLHNGKSNG